MPDIKLASTSAIAKKRSFKAQDFRQKLVVAGLIVREGDEWVLTAAGRDMGGDYKVSKQYGKYIVWPEDIELPSGDTTTKLANQPLITATTIGKYFGISSIKTNYILSELGWINKSLKGWVLEDYGKKLGGVQAEDRKSGVPYVRWPEAIIHVRALKSSVAAVTGKDEETEVNTVEKTVAQVEENKEEVGFRDKFPAKHRSTDGHMVRSKAEMLIDNWLYMAEIIHAYERKLPIEEDVYCDFYLPTGKVYIEYWGYENEEKYLARKQKKIAIYEKYGFRLIQLNDEEVKNLDDILPKMLLKYGIQAY